MTVSTTIVAVCGAFSISLVSLWLFSPSFTHRLYLRFRRRFALVIGKLVRSSFLRSLRNAEKTLGVQALEPKVLGAEDMINADDHTRAKWMELRDKVQQVQNKYLLDLLQRGRDTALGKDLNFAELSSVEKFQQSIPITTYSFYEPYIERMKNGETVNVMSPDPVMFFATSSGTTGAPKLLPVTRRSMNEMRQMPSAGVLESTCSPPELGSKTIMIVYGKSSYKKTAGGTPIAPLSQAIGAMAGGWIYVAVMGCFTTSPMSLLSDIDDAEVTRVMIHFSTTFVAFCRAVEDRGEKLLDCVDELSFASHPVLGDPQRLATNRRILLEKELEDVFLVESNPEMVKKKRVANARAVLATQHRVDATVEEKSGLLKRLWPSLEIVMTSISGPFQVYESQSRYFAGVPIYCSAYMCSEASLGYCPFIDRDGFIPQIDIVFLEFIEEPHIGKERPPTRLVTDLEIGKKYGIVITSSPGYMRYVMGDVVEMVGWTEAQWPVLSLCYREGSVLDVFGEKTSDATIKEVLEETCKLHWKGFEVREFTSVADTDSVPPRYEIFVELGLVPSDQQQDEHCVDAMKRLDPLAFDRQLTAMCPNVGRLRERHQLDAAQCRLVKEGAFSRFIDFIVSSGRSAAGQTKVPRMLKDPNHRTYMLKECFDA